MPLVAQPSLDFITAWLSSSWPNFHLGALSVNKLSTKDLFVGTKVTKSLPEPKST